MADGGSARSFRELIENALLVDEAARQSARKSWTCGPSKAVSLSVLEIKQAELVQLVRNRDGIAIQKSPDALDEVQHATERELAIRSLDRDSNLLRSVRAALRRNEDGSFGVCLHCEGEISTKRLAAVPWAPFCIQCQEVVDRCQGQGVDDLELLFNAA